jgi:hypothetical protein
VGMAGSQLLPSFEGGDGGGGVLGEIDEPWLCRDTIRPFSVAPS